jgi:colanic acid/amylovoran biosynthesis protein
VETSGIGKTRKILLVAADMGSFNLGVNALSMGTLLALSERFPEGYTVKVLNSSGKSTGWYAVTIKGQSTLIQKIRPRLRQLSKSIIKGFAMKLLPSSWCANWIRDDAILQLFDEADLVIDLSEGDSFTTIYGFRRMLRHSLHKMPAILLGKSIFLFPQTIGPFHSLFSKVVARYILNRASLIFTREPYSTMLVKDIVRESTKVIEASDMAFLMEPELVEYHLLEEHPGFVGVNISGLLYFLEDGSRDFGWTRDSYRQLMSEVVTHFAQELEKDVLLIPHVRGEGVRSDDLRASQELRASLPRNVQDRVFVVEELFSAPQLKYVVSQAEFFIGTRMHACIAALSSLVPVMAISYSHKFDGILQQLGMEDLTCNPRRTSIHKMASTVYHNHQNREQIRARLEQSVPLARSRALDCVNYL